MAGGGLHICGREGYDIYIYPTSDNVNTGRSYSCLARIVGNNGIFRRVASRNLLADTL